MTTKARLLAVACLLLTGTSRAQTIGGRGPGGPVAPAVAAGWAGQINAYFGSTSQDPSAVAGVVSSLKGLDLGSPEVRASVSPVVAQIHVSAAAALEDIRKREAAWKIWESNFPGAPLNQEHVLDAALKLRMLQALDPVLVQAQAPSFAGKAGALDEHILRAIDARLDAASLAKLDAKMNEMAAALNRALEPETAAVDASKAAAGEKELPADWKLQRAADKAPLEASIDELPAPPAAVVSWKPPENRSRAYEKARRRVLRLELNYGMDESAVDRYASGIDEWLRRVGPGPATDVLMEMMQRDLRPNETLPLPTLARSKANSVRVITRLFVARGWGRYVWEREAFQTLVRVLAAQKTVRIHREDWMKYALGGGTADIDRKWNAYMNPLAAVARAVAHDPKLPEASTVELAPYLLRGLAAAIDSLPGEIEHVEPRWRLPLMKSAENVGVVGADILSALETLARGRPELLTPGQRVAFFKTLGEIGMNPSLPADLRVRALEIERTLPREAPQGAPAREDASASVALTVRPGGTVVPAAERGPGAPKKIRNGTVASTVVGVAAGILGGLPAGLIVGGVLLVGARARAARARRVQREQTLLADPDYVEAVRELDALIETWNDPAAPLIPKS